MSISVGQITTMTDAELAQVFHDVKAEAARRVAALTALTAIVNEPSQQQECGCGCAAPRPDATRRSLFRTAPPESAKIGEIALDEKGVLSDTGVLQ